MPKSILSDHKGTLRDLLHLFWLASIYVRRPAPIFQFGPLYAWRLVILCDEALMAFLLVHGRRGTKEEIAWMVQLMEIHYHLHRAYMPESDVENLARQAPRQVTFQKKYFG